MFLNVFLTVPLHSNIFLFILQLTWSNLAYLEENGSINITIITFPSITFLSVNPNKTQQSWAGSQLCNVLEICCKYWNHICLAVFPGFHYEVLVSLMPQGLWTQIKTSENFDMHICKRSSVQHSTVLALPHTSEQPFWVPEIRGIKEARNIYVKKIKHKEKIRKMHAYYS